MFCMMNLIKKMFCMMNGGSMNNMLYVCFSFMNICVVCVFHLLYIICGSCIGGLCVQNSISFKIFVGNQMKSQRDFSSYNDASVISNLSKVCATLILFLSIFFSINCHLELV
jgi:hypothetical protein